jgi:hypothetical protein
VIVRAAQLRIVTACITISSRLFLQGLFVVNKRFTHYVTNVLLVMEIYHQQGVFPYLCTLVLCAHCMHLHNAERASCTARSIPVEHVVVRAAPRDRHCPARRADWSIQRSMGGIKIFCYSEACGLLLYLPSVLCNLTFTHMILCLFVLVTYALAVLSIDRTRGVAKNSLSLQGFSAATYRQYVICA